MLIAVSAAILITILCLVAVCLYTCRHILTAKRESNKVQDVHTLTQSSGTTMHVFTTTTQNDNTSERKKRELSA